MRFSFDDEQLALRDATRDLQIGVQRIAAVLEKYIRQYPDQWLMFQKIWDDPADSK